MNEEQKKTLLKIAKDAVEAAVTGKTFNQPTIDDAELNAKCGCFVTLKNGDELRGCLGQFISDIPLAELVADMGAASATRDSRFFSNPITKQELSEIGIEISALSPLEKTDDPAELRLGVDGIYIVKGHQSGCFLPQVATETGWSVEEFLSCCCSQKAGLAADAWKDADTEVYLFTADVFGALFNEI